MGHVGGAPQHNRLNPGHFFQFPGTGPGKTAIALMVVSIALIAAFAGFVAAGHKGGDTFFSGSPWLYGTIIPAFVAGIAGGFAAALAIATRGERSAPVLVALVWGALLLIWTILEFAFPH